MSTAATAHYLDLLSGVAARLPGNGLPWLQSVREQALERFAGLGFPTPRQEDWKYTNVQPIEKRAYRLAPASCLGMDRDDLEPFLVRGLRAHRLVFVNGLFAQELSTSGTSPNGVVLDSLSRAFSRHPELVEAHLGKVVDPGANGFAALNAAAMVDGAFVHIGQGVTLEHPLQLLFLSTPQEEGVLSQPRNLIVAAAQSRGVVIETYMSLGACDHFTNAVTELTLEAGAEIEHYKLQQESTKAYHVATIEAYQGRDSDFTSHSVVLGGRMTRNDINTTLDATGANCRFNGLYVVDGRQHVDHHTRIDHVQPGCSSREYYKGVLDGHSRGVFNGRVCVRPAAIKTDARQTNCNLLLSANAEADTKPQLEIFADDVSCSHGATVGQLDEAMLFYLRSRGIDEKAARGMLTYGFAHDIVEQVGLEAIRGLLEDALINRLPVGVGIRGER